MSPVVMMVLQVSTVASGAVVALVYVARSYRMRVRRALVDLLSAEVRAVVEDRDRISAHLERLTGWSWADLRSSLSPAPDLATAMTERDTWRLRAMAVLRSHQIVDEERRAAADEVARLTQERDDLRRRLCGDAGRIRRGSPSTPVRRPLPWSGEDPVRGLAVLAWRFLGFDLQYRRATGSTASGGWRACWRARVVTGRDERPEYRLTGFGDDHVAAIGDLADRIVEVNREVQGNGLGTCRHGEPTCPHGDCGAHCEVCLLDDPVAEDDAGAGGAGADAVGSDGVENPSDRSAAE
jgi:hypothetical protein